MRWSRSFLLLLVCTAVLILCVPCTASLHGSPSGGGSGGSDTGGPAGASAITTSDPAGFSASAHTAGSGISGSSAAAGTSQAADTTEAAGTAQGAGADGGEQPGTSKPGAAAGDPGSPPDRDGDSGRPSASSPDNGQGPGSSLDAGSGDESVPGPRYTQQDEPSRKPETGIQEEPQSGFMGAGAPGETANREGIGFQGGDEIRSPAGIIVFGAAGGIVRGSDIKNPPGPAEGAAGGHAREGASQPPWHPSRDTAQKSVPPETAARIEQGSPESPSRPKSKREDESDEEGEYRSHVHTASDPDSVPGSPLFFFFSLFGFRRIKKKNVLDNECRRAVFTAIAEAPGIDAVSLSQRLEVNINTLRYHLAKLLATDKITYLSRPGTVRYYLNQGMYSPFEQQVLHYLRAGTAGHIIRLTSERPGLSRQDLAAELGISGPSVTRHIQQLSSEGIIRNEPDGKANHYYLTDETALLLKKFQVTRTGITGRVSPAPV